MEVVSVAHRMDRTRRTGELFLGVGLLEWFVSGTRSKGLIVDGTILVILCSRGVGACKRSLIGDTGRMFLIWNALCP